ncbi:MAG TPA: hypothetical protein VMA31_05630 [Bryobacteraceae bacterium]|nr:hypothetical protein [Bryobacteraceae bacterium]
MARLWLIVLLFGRTAVAAGQPSLDDALNHLYNFDFAGAHAILDQLIAAHPSDPLPHAFRASACLFDELDRLGVLEGEFFTNDDWAYDKKRASSSDPAIRARLLQALNDTQSEGSAALRANPKDKSALFALCIGQGVTADYMALIDKHQFSSLSPSKRSNSYAQQLLQLDPKFYDAYVTAGFSEYVLGSLPFFVRWFVHFDNISGNKEIGKQHLELAAHQGHYLKAFASILLAIAAVREKRPADARTILQELAHDYPRNPLFRKELGRLEVKMSAPAN